MAESLYKALEKFSEVRGDEDILDGVMSEAARHFLFGGHFLIGSTEVFLTDIEFYYHEEVEDGLHDHLMYHINAKAPEKDMPYAPFPFGSLHSHVSGIDFTFEDQNDPCAYRASVLIRGIRWEEDGAWKREDRPTYIYNNFLMGNPVFGKGFSIKWEDDMPGNFLTLPMPGPMPRRNVPMFDEKGEKILYDANIHDKSQRLHLSKKDYVQDGRSRRFKIPTEN